MNRDYILIPKPDPIPHQISELRTLDDNFWQTHIFHFLLSFYKNHDRKKIAAIIAKEKAKQFPRTEREIAKFLRTTLRQNRAIDSAGFIVVGESTNDEEIEGNYDIEIYHSYWSPKKFPFECKNLDDSTTLVNEYVYVKNNSKTDGGVYRYFNGKYAQGQDFGGMIGFVLNGKVNDIKDKIQLKLKDPFDVTPEGDLQSVADNSIENNDFTFTSTHVRKSKNFLIYHMLFRIG